MVATPKRLLRQFIVTLTLITMLPATSGFTPPPRPTNASPGYLHTRGSQIVDASGKPVGLSGINWFGFETANFAPHGLWTRNWEDVLDQIKALGYNTIRLPFANAMLGQDVVPNGIDARQNPDLAKLSALEVMDRIIAGAGERGLWVILDNHRSSPGGGPESGGLWYTSEIPEKRWIEDWEMLAKRYKGNPTVVGVDLRNEPYGGCWGCGEAGKDWRLAAEKAGNAVLAINPDLLILVEGVATYNGQSTWWGGNLMGAEEHPVRLDVPDRLVYSPHEYPASIFPHPWFSEASYPDNLPAVWDRYWGYLVNEDIAPVLIGEFGTRYTDASDQKWMQALQKYIQQKQLHWTFWSLNPNSGDTGGLLKDDWESVQQDKQALLEKIQYSVERRPVNLPPASPSSQLAPDRSLKPLVMSTFEGASLRPWKLFRDPRSSVRLTLGAAEQPGKYAMQLTYTISASGWAGVERKFSRAQDWSAYSGLSFAFYGQNSGNPVRVELLGRRANKSGQDTAERFEAVIRDDFSGWREIRLPWSVFHRRADWQPAGAPVGSLDLTSIWGLNLAPVYGKGTFSVDQIQLAP